ncbi:L-threonylcarbamoyladenylate synthase [Thermobifida cellulosilytica]|uniref:Threonylcarbamoyl-AMP synthase n=1 Tax=Thermobifida cellulosilytica TB100 TaxID=665004 RepID=A0A147KIB4_THECS|nr:L-threonylcarbamoyladenylate synthase [Thermobifida cellulosilytica]KUP97028.1 translation factor Sua5 [Thermobifida cellulosilytica TB100]
MGDDGAARRPPVLAVSPEALEEAVRVLRGGGLVAFPTETVYGLGADAANPDAVARIFAAKGRPADHPLIVHVASAEAARGWAASFPEPARALAEAFWPGPLTLVLPRSDRVPDAVTGGRATVGLRVPDQPVALALLERFGGGVAAPSANRFGRVSPTTAEHVAADLGERVDLVVDGGPCAVGVESTIVEVDGDRLTVLRTGAVTAEDVAAVTGLPVAATPTGPARAPGMLAAHYAPRARVVLAEAPEAAETVARWVEKGHRVAVLAEVLPEGLPQGAVPLPPVASARDYARVLYQRLRDVDAAGADVVVAVPPEPAGIGLAVRDRLLRASRAH